MFGVMAFASSSHQDSGQAGVLFSHLQESQVPSHVSVTHFRTDRNGLFVLISDIIHELGIDFVLLSKPVTKQFMARGELGRVMGASNLDAISSAGNPFHWDCWQGMLLAS